MKFEVTKKEMRREEVYSVAYCDLQHLLRYEEPTAYSHGVYGWACDYYKVENIYICTGYSTVGKVVSRELVRKYEAKARKITSASYADYEKVKAKVSRLLKSFIKEIRGK